MQSFAGPGANFLIFSCVSISFSNRVFQNSINYNIVVFCFYRWKKCSMCPFLYASFSNDYTKSPFVAL